MREDYNIIIMSRDTILNIYRCICEEGFKFLVARYWCQCSFCLKLSIGVVVNFLYATLEMKRDDAFLGHVIEEIELI